MLGTTVNTISVLAGSALGIFAGKRITEELKDILMQALGLAVVVIGLQMALSAQNLIPYVVCLLLGGITGEVLGIEQGLSRFAEWLKSRFNQGSTTFVQGFVTATVLYLTGAMMIVGCIQDGTVGDSSTLVLKSLLDGVASLVLASTLGIGVAFSALPVFVVQGSLTLLSAKLLFLQNPDVLASVTSTGGMMILGIGINLLKLTQIRVGNFTPGLIYAILYPLVFV
ncbi:MAG TPA: DUF554 domain-containing protein [Deltaproteobacteria bacterium]|nr:DUF554 domain-containing protein [Deltaproteobacteria bacterium]